MENLVVGDAEISTKTDNKDILVNINGPGTMAFLEKISLHSFITSIPPGFDLMNDLKRGVEKIGNKT